MDKGGVEGDGGVEQKAEVAVRLIQLIYEFCIY